MTEIDMAAEVKRYLDKLGTTPEQIRTSLLDLKMTGGRGSHITCPLARYLRESIPDPRPTVHSAHVSWGRGYIELSDAQATFVRDFDLFRYPELVMPRVPCRRCRLSPERCTCAPAASAEANGWIP